MPRPGFTDFVDLVNTLNAMPVEAWVTAMKDGHKNAQRQTAPVRDRVRALAKRLLAVADSCEPTI